MLRYYLVPFETDEAKLIADVQPMHLDVFGIASGLIPKALKQSGSVVSEWLREYYVMCVERKNKSDYAEIEKLTDVIRLDANTELSKLSAKGMDMSSVTSRDDMDRVLTKWLIDDGKILSGILRPIIKKVETVN